MQLCISIHPCHVSNTNLKKCTVLSTKNGWELDDNIRVLSVWGCGSHVAIVATIVKLRERWRGGNRSLQRSLNFYFKLPRKLMLNFVTACFPSDPSDISSNDWPGLSEVMKYKWTSFNKLKENLIELHFIVWTTGSLVILVQVSRHATLESDLRLLHNF